MHFLFYCYSSLFIQVVVDWNQACVKDSVSGRVIPVNRAVRDGLISKETGQLLEKKADDMDRHRGPGRDIPLYKEPGASGDGEEDGEEVDTVTLTFQTTVPIEPDIKAITIEEDMDTGTKHSLYMYVYTHSQVTGNTLLFAKTC